MNVVMLRPFNEGVPDAPSRFVEVQGTAEGQAFTRAELDALRALFEVGLNTIASGQAQLVAEPPAAHPPL